MQAQDLSDDFLLRLWPKIEANRNRLIAAGVVVLAAFFVWYYISSHRQAQELAAGQAYTEFQLNHPPTVQSEEVVNGYLQIAQDYSGTMAGQRAQLQAAVTLFESGKYADAQKQFENFLNANGDNPLAASAQIGVAASLEAQGKLDQALTEYRSVPSTYPGTTTALEAKFACGRVLQLQNKFQESLTFYQDVAQSQLAGTLAQIAHLRISEIQAKLASAKPASKPVQPAAEPAKPAGKS